VEELRSGVLKGRYRKEKGKGKGKGRGGVGEMEEESRCLYLCFAEGIEITKYSESYMKINITLIVSL
jgi:hypothetical protein